MNRKKSFTLIELLVVIVIIGVLAGVIIVSTTSFVGKANVTKTRVFSESVKNKLSLNLVNDWDASNYYKNGIYWDLQDKWGGSTGVFYANSTSRECSATIGSELCPQIETDNDLGDILVFSGADGERININTGSVSNFESIHGPTTVEAWFNKTEMESAGYSTIFGDSCLE